MVKGKWIFVIVQALEARLEWAKESKEIDHEIPAIKESLAYFKKIALNGEKWIFK